MMAESKQRFLVIRLSSIGDIVHALPAVAALGETFPQAQIAWAIETRYAGLLEGNPYVWRVVRLDTLGWRKKLASAATIEEAAHSLAELRELKFDTAIDFQGLVKSALIAWLSRARERVGFAEHWLREPAAGVFYTQRVGAREPRHVIEENLALVERLGVQPCAPHRWQFPLPRNARDELAVEQKLASLGVRDFIVMSPGGGWISKRWPPAHYAGLIRGLAAELPWTTLLTGSPDEEEMIQQILVRAEPKRAVYFPATLQQFIALARRAKLFVGGDTGPLHLAAAVGAPIVAIYGPTNPKRNGPFAPADIALSNHGPIDHTRRGKNPAYLAGISVDAVHEAIRRRLEAAHV